MTLTILSTKQKQTQRHREQTCGASGEAVGGRMAQEAGISKCNLLVLLHIEWTYTKVLLCNTGNCIQYPIL